MSVEALFIIAEKWKLQIFIPCWIAKQVVVCPSHGIPAIKRWELLIQSPARWISETCWKNEARDESTCCLIPFMWNARKSHFEWQKPDPCWAWGGGQLAEKGRKGMVYILSVILVTHIARTLVKTRHAVHWKCISPYANLHLPEIDFFSPKNVSSILKRLGSPAPGCI